VSHRLEAQLLTAVKAYQAAVINAARMAEVHHHLHAVRVSEAIANGMSVSAAERSVDAQDDVLGHRQRGALAAADVEVLRAHMEALRALVLATPETVEAS
jgi:hypothetical protein